jgi:ketosteroid isomerase-like protein
MKGEAPMSEENVTIVQSMYAAFASGDVPTVLGSMDPEIVWKAAENFPYADGNPYVGPDAVVEGVFARLVGEWEYWNLAVEKLLDAGDTVVALGRYQAKNKQTATEINAQFAHVWGFRGGKVVTFQQYADTAQIQKAVAGR